MKTISFTEEEHDFLLNYYQEELKGAIEYADSIRNIIVKLGGETTEKKKPGRRGRPKVVAETPVQPVKRGRKPKVKVDEPKKEVIKKERKPRKDKGSLRVKPIKPIKEEIPVPEPVLPPVEPKQEKPPIPKKTPKKKKKQFKRKGVILAPLSKPLPVKPPEVETLPPVADTTKNQ